MIVNINHAMYKYSAHVLICFSVIEGKHSVAGEE